MPASLSGKTHQIVMFPVAIAIPDHGWQKRGGSPAELAGSMQLVGARVTGSGYREPLPSALPTLACSRSAGRASSIVYL